MQGLYLLGIIMFLVLVIIFGPIITIWALNTLFALGIELSFFTWLATLWLFGAFALRGRVNSSSS